MVFIYKYSMMLYLLVGYTLERDQISSVRPRDTSALVLPKSYFWSIWIFVVGKMIIWNWKNEIYHQRHLLLLLDVMCMELI